MEEYHLIPKAHEYIKPRKTIGYRAVKLLYYNFIG
jgi:hypothetical protein